MTYELYRNNFNYDSKIEWPLQFEGETRIKKAKHLLSPIATFEGRLFAAAQTYLVCINTVNKELLWELESTNEFDVPMDGMDGKIYLLSDDSPACLDAETGDTIWNCQADEYVLSASREMLYCVGVDDDPEPLIARSKESGDELWRIEELPGFPNKTAVEGNLTAIMGSEGIHVAETSTGELVWRSRIDNLLNRYLPGHSIRVWSMGPLIDRTLFLGFDGIESKRNGSVLAINAGSGDLIWKSEIDSKASPRTIIFNDNKLYFDLDQGWGSKNCLHCLDAKTGKIVFITEENIAPTGCANPVISHKYFIGGMGQNLSFFDLQDQRFVWRYKHKENKNLFGGSLIVSKNQLIVSDMSEKVIYWFEGK